MCKQIFSENKKDKKLELRRRKNGAIAYIEEEIKKLEHDNKLLRKACGE